ncbi:hypothetical protein THAOC_06721 [Thalassiosira oceanica]|uniref:MYND-type domain-containing protein n=1 Tax=Thalassiosira oceanica TaxID=159749 RepID=K0SZM5_THAOC|nr:hypothetical protein THAOC_06721 [Thalassiosira oceanica]|eukprot:EJK71803.1 hypothetical protein THAOC_06721 [Thalassiosira oceanica]
MMMRCVPCEANGDEVCANCGKLGSDAVKLKNCTACRLVKYCGVDCQRAHRKKHKKACKRRAAELKDERLYSQGQERPEGDFCSICTLPIPLPTGTHSGINDATRAFELWKVAAGLGSIDAHNSLGSRYFHGVGVTYDIAKAVQHWETAAMKGITMARCDLGTVEYQIGNPERAVRHYLIAAKMGDKTALNNIKEMFVDGCATKAQYAEALKGYQDSLDEMKSPERDEAYALLRQMNSAREQEQNQHGCI